MLKSPVIMFIYAAFLVACGVVAYVIAPEGANPKTALIVSGATATLVVICAILALAITMNKIAGMIGIHLGLILPLLYAGVFGWRAYQTYTGGDESKLYLANTLAVMTAASIIAFIALLMTRPKPESRGAETP